MIDEVVVGAMGESVGGRIRADVDGVVETVVEGALVDREGLHHHVVVIVGEAVVGMVEGDPNLEEDVVLAHHHVVGHRSPLIAAVVLGVAKRVAIAAEVRRVMEVMGGEDVGLLVDVRRMTMRRMVEVDAIKMRMRVIVVRKRVVVMLKWR